MIVSMTGYGKSDKKNKNYFVNVEIKSVNNRFFDPVVKLHSSIKEFEQSIINLLKNECERGRVFLNITIVDNTDKSHFKLNKGLLKSYLAILKDIDKETNNNESISSIDLIKLPDLLENVDFDDKISGIKKIVFDTVKLAIKDLNNFRKEEGNNLLNEINKHVKKIESIFKRIEKLSIKNTQKELANYKKKIKNYMPNFSKLDDERLYQEISIIIEKKDINEEIVRFKSHLNLFYLYLRSKKNEGKKKNFLLQEMNREINTIGSKSDNTKIKHFVVDIKNNLEKLREQVQNIL
mgnify:CR=1 FL=1|tara:strand:+ start:10273 stop:11151 length:879 start_codon:yes stop_codon:yes gene_type:complete